MPRAVRRHTDPDAQRRLWAPWRSTFFTQPRPRGCFFCAAVRSKIAGAHQVVARGRHAIVMLNRYPYNNGHLLVAPARHIGAFERLKPSEWLEMLALTQRALKRLKRHLRPQGYNLGLNLGRAAGAGVPGHLHVHLVPRWNGDTNFMPVLGGTKVISHSLESLYGLLNGL